jgi:hypothetical protein
MNQALDAAASTMRDSFTPGSTCHGPFGGGADKEVVSSWAAARGGGKSRQAADMDFHFELVDWEQPKTARKKPGNLPMGGARITVTLPYSSVVEENGLKAAFCLTSWAVHQRVRPEEIIFIKNAPNPGEMMFDGVVSKVRAYPPSRRHALSVHTHPPHGICCHQADHHCAAVPQARGNVTIICFTLLLGGNPNAVWDRARKLRLMCPQKKLIGHLFDFGQSDRIKAAGVPVESVDR